MANGAFTCWRVARFIPLARFNGPAKGKTRSSGAPSAF